MQAEVIRYSIGKVNNGQFRKQRAKSGNKEAKYGTDDKSSIRTHPGRSLESLSLYEGLPGVFQPYGKATQEGAEVDSG